MPYVYSPNHRPRRVTIQVCSPKYRLSVSTVFKRIHLPYGWFYLHENTSIVPVYQIFRAIASVSGHAKIDLSLTLSRVPQNTNEHPHLYQIIYFTWKSFLYLQIPLLSPETNKSEHLNQLLVVAKSIFVPHSSQSVTPMMPVNFIPANNILERLKLYPSLDQLYLPQVYRSIQFLKKLSSEIRGYVGSTHRSHRLPPHVERLLSSALQLEINVIHLCWKSFGDLAVLRASSRYISHISGSKMHSIILVIRIMFININILDIIIININLMSWH